MGLKFFEAKGVAGDKGTDVPGIQGNVLRILYGQVSLTTDSTVANRRLLLKILSPTNDLTLKISAGATVSANSNNRRHAIMAGATSLDGFTAGVLGVSIPADFLILYGWRLKVQVSNGQPGDIYSVHFALSESHEGSVI